MAENDTMTQEQDVYSALERKMKDNVGVIIRTPFSEDERVRLSPHRHPDVHPTVIKAAIWVRQERPDHSSKYKTLLVRALENSSGRYSISSDGTYADTYDEAIEWIGDESEQFSDDRIRWLDLPKLVVTEKELAEEYQEK